MFTFAAPFRIECLARDLERGFGLKFFLKFFENFLKKIWRE